MSFNRYWYLLHATFLDHCRLSLIWTPQVVPRSQTIIRRHLCTARKTHTTTMTWVAPSGFFPQIGKGSWGLCPASLHRAALRGRQRVYDFLVFAGDVLGCGSLTHQVQFQVLTRESSRDERRQALPVGKPTCVRCKLCNQASVTRPEKPHWFAVLCLNSIRTAEAVPASMRASFRTYYM